MAVFRCDLAGGRYHSARQSFQRAAVRLGTALILLAVIIAGLIATPKIAMPKLTVAAIMPQRPTVLADTPVVDVCQTETWPNISPDCVKGVTADHQVITIRRVEPARD
jgi:hypothetical protein